jgi:hypothetical protein
MPRVITGKRTVVQWSVIACSKFDLSGTVRYMAHAHLADLVLQFSSVERPLDEGTSEDL